MWRRVLAAGWLLGWVLLACSPAAFARAENETAGAASGVDFFESKIRPILVQRCYECHSPRAKTIQGGLHLDTRSGILAGGDSGPSIVPGKPEASSLIEAIGYAGDTQMPPSGKLPAEEIALLTDWVRRGAPLPDDGSAAKAKRVIDIAAGRQFWSFQPPRHVDRSNVDTHGWSRQPIDPFIWETLAKQNMQPSVEASRQTLIRRATFDLVGLPPSPEEVDAFVRDERPDAYEQLIERLLASPQYGERWARYWLDLARYTDTTPSWIPLAGEAWLYRDWVVQSLNDDMPYDQFVSRQLAADLMPDLPPAEVAALGFLGLSPVYWKELKLDKEVIKGIVADEWEERIDAIGRTFLGLTLACARCHDHKFDPLTTEDYYSFAGVLASTRMLGRPILPQSEAAIVQQAKTNVQSRQARIKKLSAAKPVAAESQAEIDKLRAEVAEIEHTTPHYKSPLAAAVDDAALYVLADGAHATKLDYKPGEAIDLQLQIRGNPSKLGPLVPRRFIKVLSPEEPRPLNHGSGRLELAQAIVGEAAPLSARVMVNRVWKYHFGRGLVESASDFGAQGARPTHPELLDDLAARFIERGWSLKWLHRELMTSATYRQSSAHDAAKFAADPENRWLWRMNRRRLDIEAWRDSMLAVTGTLDPQRGGPAVALTDAKNRRRTVYGRVDREDPDDMLRLHDFPDAAAHSPGRDPTTTPLQQLFVLNSPFLQREAAELAKRITTEKPGDLAAQIQRAYQLLYGRAATEKQLELGMLYLTGGNPSDKLTTGATAADSTAAAPANTTPTDAAWQAYAQVLLGTSEFLFID